MNRLINYPDELASITIRLLQNNYQNPTYPYCGKTACNDCIAFDSKSERSRCKIENWCAENAKYLTDTSGNIVWKSFADAFLSTFTLQKYPHLYV